MRPGLSPGFFLVDGTAGRPAVGPLLRLNIHLADVVAAPTVWPTVLGLLESAGFGYRAKVSSNRRLFPRRDRSGTRCFSVVRPRTAPSGDEPRRNRRTIEEDMFLSTETHVVVIDDWASVDAAPRSELVTAPPELRPSLERALQLVGVNRPSEDEQVKRWVDRSLSAAGVDPAVDDVVAIRELRRAVPGLRLQSAVELVRTARRVQKAVDS